jgi:hypothetical protein
MATGGGEGSLGLLVKEFECWLETVPDGQIYLLQVKFSYMLCIFVSVMQLYSSSVCMKL